MICDKCMEVISRKVWEKYGGLCPECFEAKEEREYLIEEARG